MSASQKPTPGAYVQELNSFPNAVVEVATAVPAFIGYTEKAMRGARCVRNEPTRIASFREYEEFFGGQAPTKVALGADGKTVSAVVSASRFFMSGSLRLYFDNGGGPCYIVSVGSYTDAMANGKSATTLCRESLASLRKALEPTLVVVPDAVLLDSAADCRDVAQQVLQHCGEMQSRIGILDVYDGDLKRTGSDDDDVISGRDGFRSVASDCLGYGTAYYPWLVTSLLEDGDVDYSRIQHDCLPGFVAHLKSAADSGIADPDRLAKLKMMLDKIAEPEDNPPSADQVTARTGIHNLLCAALPAYKTVMEEVKASLNLMPPSGGVAGVYARTDATVGVQMAPANTGINSVVAAAVDITNTEQEDLNAPLDGKAINAIRTLPGRGLVIWGARTLDGNSQDWRYVNVRRTMIMLEQSIKAACQAYVFAPNNSQTWSSVKQMISSFLTSQWKAGVLMGSKPSDAFSVDVGLGSTMTGNDVLDGYMNVSVRVCLVRPAEFIVVTFQQLMAGA
jgi:phage tail sheath protein FI